MPKKSTALPAPPAPANRSPRAPLDRKRIAGAAMVLIDEQGIEALTMRALGATLEVEAMALYHHFANKSDLLDGVKDLLLDDVEQDVDTHAAPLTQIKATFAQLRRLALAHPDIIATLASGSYRSARAMAFFERLAGLFSATGLDARQSARYYGLMLQYTLGSGMFGAAPADDAAVAVPAAGDAQRYPHWHAMRRQAGPDTRDADYAFGIGLIFDAMRAASAGAGER
jgi:TetR/AcrR family tetracycline transcriptional repressor